VSVVLHVVFIPTPNSFHLHRRQLSFFWEISIHVPQTGKKVSPNHALFEPQNFNFSYAMTKQLSIKPLNIVWFILRNMYVL